MLRSSSTRAIVLVTDASPTNPQRRRSRSAGADCLPHKYGRSTANAKGYAKLFGPDQISRTRIASLRRAERRRNLVPAVPRAARLLRDARNDSVEPCGM